MKTPPIVSAQDWDAALNDMLVKEKEVQRARDALNAQRRRMPWLPVEKEYVFDGPDGKVSLLDLFDGRRQLIVYRAFIEPGTGGDDVPGHPGWPEPQATHVEVTFISAGEYTEVTLRHTGWTNRPDGPTVRARYADGWPGVMDRYTAAAAGRS